MRIAALTIKWDHQVDRACLYPWPDLVEVCNEGGIIHNTVEGILVGHVYHVLGAEILYVVGYWNMDARFRFPSSFVPRLCESQPQVTPERVA